MMYRRVSALQVRTRCVSSSAHSTQPVTARDMRIPTPLSVGFNMKYQAAGSVTAGESPRPLVCMAGWMGAKESQLKAYLKFYRERNIDVLYFAVGPKHVLFPDSAMRHMEHVLDSMAFPKGEIKEPSKILFHHFSMGGYLFGQALLAMRNHAEKYAPIRQKICGQIFDSPPDFNSISTGLSESFGISSIPVKKAIAAVANGYLSLTADNVGVKHRAASAAFHGNSILAPALWYYSKADPVSLWSDCEEVCAKWRQRGIDVEQCVWEHTPHIQHGRLDPEKYFGTLDRFLQKHDVISKTKC